VSEHIQAFDLDREANCQALSALLVGKQVYGIKRYDNVTCVTLHDCTVSFVEGNAVVRSHG
jgi:hypothetical protein